MTYMRRWGSPVKRPPRPPLVLDERGRAPNYVVEVLDGFMVLRHQPSGLEEKAAYSGPIKSVAGYACLRKLEHRLHARVAELAS